MPEYSIKAVVIVDGLVVRSYLRCYAICFLFRLGLSWCAGEAIHRFGRDSGLAID